MCAAGLQSASYWTPVEKLILHLSPVTRRKAVKTQGLNQGTNNNNSVHEQLQRRGRRTHSEPSPGHGSNRASLESIQNTSVTQQHSNTYSRSVNENENIPPVPSANNARTSHINSLHNQKDGNNVHKINGHHGFVNGFQSGSFLPCSSPRHHRNILLRRRGGENHATKTSINSSSSNSLSSPTSGSASSENDDQSLFSNEIQTMKCHSIYKVCN